MILDSPEVRFDEPIRGRVEVSVVPPFDEGTVSIYFDGKRIAQSSRPPHAVEVDLGSAAVEHRIVVAARDRQSGDVSRWSFVINRGQHPLSLDIRHASGEQEVFEAVVTAPSDDPVTLVEFFDGGTLLATMPKPPYRLRTPADFQPSLLYATARTRSGREITNYLNFSDTVVSSYEVRSVPIYVTVTDERGAARNDLDRSAFRVMDNGREAQILEVRKAFEEPFSLALLMDASGSMTHEMKNVIAAATEFTRKVQREQDEVAVFSIGSVPKRELGLSRDRAAVAQTLRAMTAGGETALFDSIASAIRELRDVKRRRAIVILTDGEDTASFRSFVELLNEAKAAAIPIYVIVFQTRLQSHGSRFVDQMTLLASQTGGFLAQATARDLVKQYERIENDLRAQYAITYQVAESSSPNEWRPVRVVVRSPRLTARTISGYFTP